MKNKQKVRAKFRQQHNLHDSFFKQIFKNPKYLKELLQVIFPPEVIEHARLDDIGIKDGELTKLASGPLHADLVVALRVSDGQT